MSGTLVERQDKNAYAKQKPNSIHALIDYNEARMLAFTPMVEGHGIFVCLSMPKIMEDIFPIRTANIKNLLNTYVTGLSGIQDLTAEFGEVNMGTEGNSYETHIKTGGAIKEITTTMPSDVAGALITNYAEELVRIVYDPDSGQAYTRNPNLRQWSPANHSFVFLWMNVSPDFTFVNKAYLFQKAELVNAPMEKFNAKKGETAINELELNFKVIARNNRNAILNTANKYLVQFRASFEQQIADQNKKFG